jgi:hypothetical protein
MRPDGGGGGTTIVIDPDSLRRAGSRLKGVAGELQRLQTALASLDVPLLPPSVAGIVPGAISAGSSATSSSAPSLEDVVVELTRRAFWAEYADQLMAGYPLSGSALKEFQQYLQDGTLLQYATADEARAAGVELAKMGADFRKNPSILFSLALSLKGGESVADQTLRNEFSAGFVNQFGATRMSEIPRAIQALESSQQLAFNSSDTDPFLLRDVAQLAQQQGLEVHGDPLKDLLAPFSVALADATSAGLVTRTIEQKIASNRDSWSTAALLSQGGHFGTPFLLDCFKSGVVDKIAQESPYHILGNPSGPQLPVEYTLGWDDGHPLPNDTKQIVLAALARNPEAAAEALTMPLSDVQVANEYGQWNHVTDPVQLLYQYGHFDDHGAAFGDAFNAGEAYAHGNGQAGAASRLTQTVIDQVLDHHQDGMSGLQPALAKTLGDHYMHSLYVSADGGGNGADYDPDHDGIIGQSNADGIDLSRRQVQNLVGTLIADDGSRQPLLHGVTAYEANQIRTGIASGASPAQWAHQIGSFNGLLNSANAENTVGDVQAAEARQDAISSALGDVVSLLPIPPDVSVVAAHVPDLVAQHWGPHGPSATVQIGDFREHLQDQLDAALTSGYVDAHPDLGAAIPSQVAAMGQQPGWTPTSFVDSSGHVLPWNQMTADQQRTFNAWYEHETSIQHLAGDARAQAHDGFRQQSEDQTGN